LGRASISVTSVDVYLICDLTEGKMEAMKDLHAAVEGRRVTTLFCVWEHIYTQEAGRPRRASILDYRWGRTVGEVSSAKAAGNAAALGDDRE